MLDSTVVWLRMRSFGWIAIACALLSSAAGAAQGKDETVEQAVCRLIEQSAAAEDLPLEFFTRLIWKESRFRPRAVSPKGAQGVAQFMPGTAKLRDLADPFDPETALPASAAFLAELRDQFGNLGLAAAGYNAGPNRVASWIGGRGFLPLETEDYVLFITKRPADDWMPKADGSIPSFDGSSKSCLELLASLKTEADRDELVSPTAPWHVQIAGNFSKGRALASYNRVRRRFPQLMAGIQPMIVGTRMLSMGTRRFYRVSVPAQSRAEGNQFCSRLRRAGGACIVLRN
ncbi:lytic transglycosylase domain-containing protein [Inquilinus limosus]|uniref:lytic transglycosylase domain-containing protein n=1 Tax=Inquilinus limosus TaxID=171674 RepID=UPI0003FE746C|nr:lytic transglycosylase domain-containing protein [Inquilinus limosus]